MTTIGEEPLDEAPFSIDFFDVVVARACAGGHGLGRRGTVLGRSRGDDGAEWYAVSFDDTRQTSMIARSDLEPTGERRRREDVYDGTRTRVSGTGDPL